MTKILTAISEENIIKKIIKNKITDNKNILYKEAILDTLKNNKNIEIIIISEKIPGDINFLKLIKKIQKINKKIKIIIILNNKKIEKELIKNNIKEIYYNNFFSINKLIKKLKQKNNKKNFLLDKTNTKRKNRILKRIIDKTKKYIDIKKENNVICIFGKNKIDKKIIKLIIIKKLIKKNKKIVIINLKIKNKKIKNKEITKIKKIKNKYYLKLKNKYPIKEKIIDNHIKQIININKILKNKNNLIKINILRTLIKKYKTNKYYIIFNVSNISNKLEINKINFFNKIINIIIIENNKKNLLELNKNINKIINKNIYLIIINYNKNNLSKYFYKLILKNKISKIKIINK